MLRECLHFFPLTVQQCKHVGQCLHRLLKLRISPHPKLQLAELSGLFFLVVLGGKMCSPNQDLNLRPIAYHANVLATDSLCYVNNAKLNNLVKW